MDCSKCVCSKSGFCPLFNKEISQGSQLWQWCKNTTPQERKKHKDFCSKSFLEETTNPPRYVTTENLVRDSIDILLPKILKDHKNIAGIIGIPRSGMTPASVIATKLSLPLCSLKDGEIVILNSFSSHGGYRMKHYKHIDGPLLFVDDTVNTGISAINVKKKFPECLFATVYSTKEAAKEVDYYGRLLDNPHILEWNIFNSQFAHYTLFDIDGIFCENIPIGVCKNDEDYARYIENVEPIHTRIPKLFKAKALVTGRLERYRNITEAWLEKYNFNYEDLIMFPTELEERRNSNHAIEVGSYKGRMMNRLGASFFVESEMSEAQVIKQTYNYGTVICPNQRICL